MTNNKYTHTWMTIYSRPNVTISSVYLPLYGAKGSLTVGTFYSSPFRLPKLAANINSVKLIREFAWIAEHAPSFVVTVSESGTYPLGSPLLILCICQEFKLVVLFVRIGDQYWVFYLVSESKFQISWIIMVKSLRISLESLLKHNFILNSLDTKIIRRLKLLSMLTCIWPFIS